MCAGPLPAAAPKLPLGPAVGDDAESVRWRLRERVSGPGGDDAGDELGDRALGGGGALLWDPGRAMFHSTGFP